MLVFVIPLKSQQVSKDWERVCKIFERTAKSVCNQTSPDFRVIVVCNQKPQIEFNHPNLTYIEVDFPIPKGKNKIAAGDTDIGRKTLKGLITAKSLSPSHTMRVDADDCVSNKLAEFVKKNPQSDGWYINRGYKYIEGSKYIYIKRRNFYQMCGSCHLIRYDLHDLPEVGEYNRGYGYYKYHIEHGKVKGMLEEKGAQIKPLPFAGAVYMLDNGENVYGSQSRLKFKFLNLRVLTPSICEEFGIYQLDDPQLD